MWFPCRQILVEIHLQYPEQVSDNSPRVFCKSGHDTVVKSEIHSNMQKISFNIQAPEVFLLDATNSNSIAYKVSKLFINGVEINDKCYNKVFKIASNNRNLPVTAQNINNFQQKFGDTLSGNSYMIFDIYENDAITYLLSIGNKIIF